MIVVSPFRPFPPESREHRELGPFDWVAALRLLRASVRHTCRCETYALTDVDTDLAVPMIQVETTERRLMLWIVEACLRYLESDAFTEDTILLSPDVLVFQDLRGHFRGDLTVVVRLEEKHAGWPLINVAQWWPRQSRAKLVAFYEAILERARTLPEAVITWGADTEPMAHLLAPLAEGFVERQVAGQTLRVQMLPARTCLRTMSSKAIEALQSDQAVKWPSVPIIDCRSFRKRHMAQYFAATLGQRGVAA